MTKGHNTMASISGTELEAPKAIKTAELQIGPVTLRVHNLDNGQRVIEEQSMIDFFAALERGELNLSDSDAMAIAKVLR